MAEPNSPHVQAVPDVPGNGYDATSDAPLGSWRKVGHSGQGWTDTDDIPGADTPPWRQT